MTYQPSALRIVRRASAIAAMVGALSLGVTEAEAEAEARTFNVSVYQQGRWLEVAQLPYTRFYTSAC